MKWLIWLLLVITAAVGLALLISANDGYVLLVIGFLSLHGLLRLIGYMLRLPGHVRTYKQTQRRKEAHAAVLEGLHAFGFDVDVNVNDQHGLPPSSIKVR